MLERSNAATSETASVQPSSFPTDVACAEEFGPKIPSVPKSCVQKTNSDDMQIIRMELVIHRLRSKSVMLLCPSLSWNPAEELLILDILEPRAHVLLVLQCLDYCEPRWGRALDDVNTALQTYSWSLRSLVGLAPQISSLQGFKNASASVVQLRRSSAGLCTMVPQIYWHAVHRHHSRPDPFAGLDVLGSERDMRCGSYGTQLGLVTRLVAAWHLVTWTFTLCGRRGSYGTQLGLVTRLVAVDAASFCVAGVALGDMDLRFVWQAWHLATWIFTLCGRRGTYGTQLGLVTRLVAVDAASFYSAWLAWHLVTGTFTLCGRRGRGTYGTQLGLVTRLVAVDAASFCVAGVALGDTDLRFVWQAWRLATWIFTSKTRKHHQAEGFRGEGRRLGMLAETCRETSYGETSPDLKAYVVLREDGALVVTRIAQLLGALGETRILDNHAHQAQVAADESLRMAKERQAQGLAAGKEVVDVIRELTLLRGRGGSERICNLSEMADLCAIRGWFLRTEFRVIVSQPLMPGMKFSDDSMALMMTAQAHSANGIRLQEKDENQGNSGDDQWNAGFEAGCENELRAADQLAHTLSSTMLSTQDKSGGFTPLQLACEKGHADVIEVLLEGDPDKGARLKESLDKWSGFTALHLVAYRGHEDAAKVMLRLAPDKRALLSSKDERGRTAGDLAMERGRRNEQEINALSGLHRVGATAEPNPMSQFLHLNMLEALGRLADGIYRLKGYSELNHAALYKILRKWDKVLHRNDGVAQIYPQIIEGTRIGDMSALEALDANVKEAFSQRSPAPNQDISPEINVFREYPTIFC
eukprot:s1599_g9.t1